MQNGVETPFHGLQNSTPYWIDKFLASELTKVKIKNKIEKNNLN